MTERNNDRTTPCVPVTGMAGFSDGLGTLELVLKSSVSFVLFMIFSSDSLSVVWHTVDRCRCGHIGSPLSVALLTGSQGAPQNQIFCDGHHIR
jgi:hypothetical protein